jgi:RNA polymerase sigma factor (sigma-70 family)
MASVLSVVIRQLKTELARDGLDLTDGALLERFLGQHDEGAFAQLVLRHGPMVLGVCRRLLRDPHDAEDAFQATFLVAIRKAASIQPRELFGAWLHGVAYRTALAARSGIARRRAREKQTDDLPHPPQVEPGPDLAELRQLLDRELSRLPEKYRVPVVLCELEGRSRRDVARQLRLPEGTLSSRLATARKMLARRMSRHGATPPGANLAAIMAGGAACADVPAALAGATIQGGALVAAGRASLAAVGSPRVVALTEGVLKAMLLTKLKVLGLVVLTVAALVAVAGVGGHRAEATEQDRARQADTRDADEPEAKAPTADDGREVITGSGKKITRELKLSDFTSVDVGSAFEVEITQGKAFRVAITADDNVIPFVKAAKDGSALKIGLDSERRSFHNATLKAAVTMPHVEGLTVSGACQVTLAGFTSEKDCKLRLSGASTLKGDLQAATVALVADGASRIALKGSAKKAKLSCHGASTLALAEFTLDSAGVTLTGASRATVRARSALDYHLSGASSLKYGGEPKIGKKQVTGASSATRLPQP